MDLLRGLLLLGLTLSSSSSSGLPPALDITRLEPTGPGCASDLRALRLGLDSGERWAQTMWDASVKAPVGLLSQTGVQYGDFDECLTLRTPVTGQFCLVDVFPVESNNSAWASFKWGVCTPASCSPQDLRTALQGYMDKESVPANAVRVGLEPQTCTTWESTSRPLTTSDFIYCAVMVSVVLMVCIATVLDLKFRPHYDGFSPPASIGQCLSARQGFCSLLRKEQQLPGINLSALYGLHACAFFFVVMGHRFGVHLYFMSLTNYRTIEHMFSGSWSSEFVGHFDLFVDVFFFLSSFLLAVLYFSELQKRFLNPIMVYTQRLCRIVPAYAAVVFFYATWLRQLGDGPMWNAFMDVEQSKCQNYWWTNLLFINTYVHKDNMCLLQSWYIACDFQLFLVGTLLVFLLYHHPRLGVVATVIVFLASTLTAFFGTYLYNQPAMLLFYPDFWRDARHHDMFLTVYSQGHYRGTSYLAGLAVGCYVHTRRHQPLTKRETYTLQVLGPACCMLVFWSGSLFYDLSASHSPLVSGLYAALHHSAFGLGLALVMLSFAIGTPTVMSQLFSWKGFVPLSKLSYCVYLIHNIPQFMWIASSRTTVHFSILELVSWTIADIVVSLVAALVLSLTIESPIRYLVKFLSTGPPSSKTVSKIAESQETIITIQDPFNFGKKVISEDLK